MAKIIYLALLLTLVACTPNPGLVLDLKQQIFLDVIDRYFVDVVENYGNI